MRESVYVVDAMHLSYPEVHKANMDLLPARLEVTRNVVLKVEEHKACSHGSQL
ncbi:polyketide synthase [Moniliophthora roreri]|nr:polyketide synthase [Moniliophthora roreri]